jgi:hypothetical protein
MSQLCTVKPSEKITDIPALQKALDDLGLKLEQNKAVRFYHGTETCTYGATLPGKYDIGFVKMPDGTYGFRADNELLGGRSGSDGYGRGDAGRKVLGENCGKLFQRYRYRLLEKGLYAKGLHILSTKTGSKGELLLDVQKIAVGAR